MSCSALSEEVEIVIEYPEEVVVEVPVAESGIYMYVCAECGGDLTEIPTYNRYYCENCGLHY